MRFHERLVVEVRDYSVLDIATNIEHLKRTKTNSNLIAVYTSKLFKISNKAPCKCPKDLEAEVQRGSVS